MSDSIEDLKKKELENKINLLKAGIDRLDSKDEKPERFTLQQLLTIVTIIASIVTIWVKSGEYLDQQQAAYTRTVNARMVQFVNQLSSDKEDERELALMMLSYFEFDAVPIFLYKLEKSSTGNAYSIIILIKNVINKKNSESLIGTIKHTTLDLFKKEMKKGILNLQVDALINYIQLLEELEVRDQELYLQLRNLVVDYQDPEIATKPAFAPIVNDFRANILPKLMVISNSSDLK
ncbi:hypothetical protein [Ekhidna sp.]|uniref:hypothetical protein n=1 Tax=Ekhidna sp. TaxID=2608089 RepID=UPI003299EF9A